MKKKVIAVLGGGNGAHMMAADMKLRGHDVRLFEMPQFKSNIQKLFDTKTIDVVGTLKGKAVLDVVILNKQPTFLGEKIPVAAGQSS